MYIPFENQDFIALSGCDCHVHIYQITKEPFDLVFRNSLKGHTDKIKALARGEVNGKSVLASGSLDQFLRLWVFQKNEEIGEHKNVLILNEEISVRLESVLLGHTEGITGLEFFRSVSGQSKSFCI